MYANKTLLYVCMYVCMYVCTYLFMYVCKVGMYICMCSLMISPSPSRPYVYVCMHACMYVYNAQGIQRCMYICMQAHEVIASVHIGQEGLARCSQLTSLKNAIVLLLKCSQHRVAGMAHGNSAYIHTYTYCTYIQ